MELKKTFFHSNWESFFLRAIALTNDDSDVSPKEKAICSQVHEYASCLLGLATYSKLNSASHLSSIFYNLNDLDDAHRPKFSSAFMSERETSHKNSTTLITAK